MRKGTLLIGLLGVAAAGLLAVPLLNPDVLASEARYRTCAKTLSADCLAGLAVEAGLSGKAPFELFGEVALLRDQDAHALVARALEQRGKSSENAYREADGRLAPLRIARAVRQGMTPAEAYEAVPQVRYGSVYIAALDLLGKNPSRGTGGATVPTDADHLAVAGFAELLIGLAVDLHGRQREGALEDAAELVGLLGDHDRATQIFLGIERDDDWSGIISPSLINPTIAAVALDQCGARAECRVHVLHRAAMVAETQVEAEAMLREAFAIHQSQEPWPDFIEMTKVVKLAVDLKNAPLALELARALDQLAQSRKGVFPAFPHIGAAQGLMAAGAPDEEVRAALNRVQAETPKSVGTIIGLGHMGPITWGGGIGEQALREQAALWARLGEADHAIQLIDGIEDPAYAWGEVLQADLSPAVQEQLISAAEGALTKAEWLRLRVQILQLPDRPRETPEHTMSTAREVVAAVDLGDEATVWTCIFVARIGRNAGDAELERQALDCAGRAAIQSRDSALLLRAAGYWFNYESTKSAPLP